MVRAEITRELGLGQDGKRRYIYSVTVQGKPLDTFESPRLARKAAAERLKWYPHANQIVEMWTGGKTYRATKGGKPSLEKIQNDY